MLPCVTIWLRYVRRHAFGEVRLMTDYDVFISYSHSDSKLVTPIVKLLEAGGRRVFWDGAIKPGQLWADEIRDSLGTVMTVVILWCCHAARSDGVADEIEEARTRSRGLVPVLLCSYPRSSLLEKYQWIDCRSVVRHRCRMHRVPRVQVSAAPDVRDILAENGDHEQKGFASPKRAGCASVKAVGCSFAATLAILLFMLAGVGVTWSDTPIDRTNVVLLWLAVSTVIATVITFNWWRESRRANDLAQTIAALVRLSEEGRLGGMTR